VEFGDDLVWNYMPDNTRRLANSLPANPALVYEAHSTDYQEPEALARMVEDHFAILKVGPWLTFAFREGVFALSDIERELFASQSGAWVSRVREELEAAMLRNPVHWRTYYHGDAAALARAFSLSDRCRYYWPDAAIQRELQQLLCNLGGRAIPLGLLSQYLPAEYAAIRAGQLTNEPHALIQHHIRAVLTIYSAACGANRGCNQTD
jgi:D-tagatose-1,6-bisphosphate aldolase subunit GatZ/KbaZ